MPVTLASHRDEPLRVAGSILFGAGAAVATVLHRDLWAASCLATTAGLLIKPGDVLANTLDALGPESPARRFGVFLGATTLGLMAQRNPYTLVAGTLFNVGATILANHMTPAKQFVPQVVAVATALKQVVKPSEPTIGQKQDQPQL